MKLYKILLINLILVLGSFQSYAAANAGADDLPAAVEGTADDRLAYNIRPYADLPAAIQARVDAEGLGSKKPTDATWIYERVLMDQKLGFYRRTVEDYITSCRESGASTRLIIGCGHASSPDGDGSCEGHGAAYYTVNIVDGRHPDLLGDVFGLMGYIFKPGVWDFINFECFPWSTGFKVDNLRQIAESLSPCGYFLEVNKFSTMPRSITVGPRGEEIETTFKAPAYKDIDPTKPAFSILHQACDLGNVSKETPDERVFEAPEHLQSVVSIYFKSLGFASGFLLLPPATVHYEWIEPTFALLESGVVTLKDKETGAQIPSTRFQLAEIKDVKDPITGRSHTYKPDELVTTGDKDLDALMGEEFLHRLHLGEEQGQDTILFFGKG